MRGQTRLGVSNRLQSLDDAVEAADETFATTRQSRATTRTAGSDPTPAAASPEVLSSSDAAKTTKSGSGESGQTRSTLETTDTIGIAARAPPHRNVIVKALNVPCFRAQITEEIALGTGQGFENDYLSSSSKEGLEEAEVDQRGRKVCVRPGKLPNKGVGNSYQQIGAGSKSSADLERSLGGQQGL